MDGRIAIIVRDGLGPYWSRTPAEVIVEEHPWAPWFPDRQSKQEAIDYIKANRTNPTEDEVTELRERAHNEFNEMFAIGLNNWAKSQR